MNILDRDNLDDVGRQKTRQYKDMVHPVHFEPLILSIGGTLSHGTQLIFDHWAATSPVFKRAQELMSISLLRSRAQHFELGHPIPA